jgi:hypothetical protein
VRVARAKRSLTADKPHIQKERRSGVRLKAQGAAAPHWGAYEVGGRMPSQPRPRGKTGGSQTGATSGSPRFEAAQAADPVWGVKPRTPRKRGQVVQVGKPQGSPYRGEHGTGEVATQYLPTLAWGAPEGRSPLERVAREGK